MAFFEKDYEIACDFKKPLKNGTHVKHLEYISPTFHIGTYLLPFNQGVDSYEDKPCVKLFDVEQQITIAYEWRVKGRYHRDKGPATIYLKGSKAYLRYMNLNSTLGERTIDDCDEITPDLIFMELE
jgi:hypothetical protein